MANDWSARKLGGGNCARSQFIATATAVKEIKRNIADEQ